MAETYYVGLDIHKKTVSYCAKRACGEVIDEGVIPARRKDLVRWAKQLEGQWIGGMEATLFTGWIYDTLKPFAEELKVAHPAMLKAIAVGKNKSDRLDARKIADLTRCNLLVESYMPPPEVRQLRTVLRYRNLVVGQAVQIKNRMAGLLMETGTAYNSKKLHGQRYFRELMSELEGVPDSVVQLLRLSRNGLESLQQLERRLIRGLLGQPLLAQRVELLRTIPGVGIITGLTWALEIGEVSRIPSIGQGISYCGLCQSLNESAGKAQRGPISKKRNKHLQRTLIEAAKLAPRFHPRLAGVYQKALEEGHANRATIEVARKLVAYLLAVDRSGRPFQLRV